MSGGGAANKPAEAPNCKSFMNKSLKTGENITGTCIGKGSFCYY